MAYTALTGSTSMMGEKAGALGRIGSNVAMMGGTGFAMTGGTPLGAGVGMAVGALTSIGDIMTLFKDNTHEYYL